MNDQLSASLPPATVVQPWRVWALTALCLATALACHFSGSADTQAEPGVVLDLPLAVPGYTGYPEPISEAELTQLPKDTEFARKKYLSPEGQTIVASIILSGSDRRSIHRPELCLPGQGWTIRGGAVEPVSLASGRTLDVMALDLSRPLQNDAGQRRTLESLYLYWFIGADKVTPHHWQRIFLTSWDLAFRNVAHRWAYVIVHTLIPSSVREGGADKTQTLDSLKKFTASIVPYFQKSERITP